MSRFVTVLESLWSFVTFWGGGSDMRREKMWGCCYCPLWQHNKVTIQCDGLGAESEIQWLLENNVYMINKYVGDHSKHVIIALFVLGKHWFYPYCFRITKRIFANKKPIKSNLAFSLLILCKASHHRSKDFHLFRFSKTQLHSKNTMNCRSTACIILQSSSMHIAFH